MVVPVEAGTGAPAGQRDGVVVMEVSVTLDEKDLRALIINWLKEQSNGELAEPKITFHMYGSGTDHPTYSATVVLAEPDPFINGPYR